MPLFEYRCENCDATFEEIVRADSTPRCPECDSTALRKLISGFAVGGGQRPSRSVPAFSGG
jgi:putative FmdB family regulatory protein